MKKLIFFFALAVSICGCEKNNVTTQNDIVYQKIDLRVPLNTTFAHKFDFGNSYTADVNFSFSKLGSTFTARYQEYHGGYGFRCMGINDYVDKLDLHERIVPDKATIQANKFLEVSVAGSDIGYLSTNGVRLDEEAYVPFCTYNRGANEIPTVGWIRIKCTQDELYIYDLAYKREGDIKAGEK